MKPLPRHAVLILIDVQNGFDDPRWGTRNNPAAEENMARLLEAFRSHGRPVIFVQHMSQQPDSPLRPGQPGNAIKPVVAPRGERVIQKIVHSAFINTSLERTLRAAAQDTIILTGLTTDQCVSTTARMGADMGFTVYVVTDATATFGRKGLDGQLIPAQAVHDVSLASLEGEFAALVSTEQVLTGIAAG